MLNDSPPKKQARLFTVEKTSDRRYLDSIFESSAKQHADTFRCFPNVKFPLYSIGPLLFSP